MSENEIEFQVKMTCQSCVDSVKRILDKNNIQLVSIDLKKQQVVVKSSLNCFDIKDILESSGKTAALVGQGRLGAAVAEIKGENIKGVIRLSQINKEECLIEGVVDGLTPGSHGLNIHEFGDLTDGCNNCGDHFNPNGYLHGDRANSESHYGDLGNIIANDSGRAKFRILDEIIKVWDIIGRSMVVHESSDDLGKGENESSKINGNSGPGIACAIIARSSGLFENSKRLCTCDGISIWDERNVPVVGTERSSFNFSQKL